MTNHYGVEIRCPECNGPHTSCFFNTTGTSISCQNKLSIYPNPCLSVGKYAFLTYHHSDERFGEIIGKVSWNYPFDSAIQQIREDGLEYDLCPKCNKVGFRGDPEINRKANATFIQCTCGWKHPDYRTPPLEKFLWKSYTENLGKEGCS